MPEDRPTITTVAQLANVSVASASRALNGIRTTPAVYERVIEAAERIGYVPNAAARSLRSRQTGQIAFAMPDVANPVYTAMVASIQEVVARERPAPRPPLDRAATSRKSSRSCRSSSAGSRTG